MLNLFDHSSRELRGSSLQKSKLSYAYDVAIYAKNY
jgi:hypothetical protein